MMQMGAIDRVLTQQALITGQVRDGLTERPPLYPPLVTLLYQPETDQPERYYPLTARLYRNGRFVFPGAPTTSFPRLSAGSTLDLLLRVSAPRYQMQEIPITLAAADLTLTEVTHERDGYSMTVYLLDAPLFDQTVDLLPQPLHLNGRVVEADNPQTPIANATVGLSEPIVVGPFQTDVDGYFTIYDLPVVNEVRFQAQHTGFVSLSTWITLDYGQPVNQMTFALRHT